MCFKSTKKVITQEVGAIYYYLNLYIIFFSHKCHCQINSNIKKSPLSNESTSYIAIKMFLDILYLLNLF
jgi:hypothetical protein